jgi:hypothetical protein
MNVRRLLAIVIEPKTLRNMLNMLHFINLLLMSGKRLSLTIIRRLKRKSKLVKLEPEYKMNMKK